jgi:hypothetical protein
MKFLHQLRSNLPTFREAMRVGSSLLLAVGQRVPFLKPCATVFLESQGSRNLLQLALPLGVTYVGTHALSGASVAVIPSGTSSNPAVAPVGRKFKWFFQSSGSHLFNSHTVTGLPPGLTYTFGKPIASITGKATTAGSYTVSIVGWEGTTENGRKSPVYKLKIKVVKAEPDIAIEQPPGSKLVDGRSSRSFGSGVVGIGGVKKSFKITNTGILALTRLSVSVAGANPTDFPASPLPVTKLKPGESTIIKMGFKPTAVGTRTATLVVSSNDPDESPFEITLTGLGVN